MVIEGLECPECGGYVLDSGDSCGRCGAKYTREIVAIQRLHHSQKMANVAALKEGNMTEVQALQKLPKVIGRANDGQLILDVPCKKPTVEPEVAPIEGLVGKVRKFLGSLRA